MSSFLQSKNWASFRSSLGWRAHSVRQTLMLERPLPFHKSFLYAPEVHINKIKISELVKRVTMMDWGYRPIFLRLEVIDELSHKNQSIIVELKKNRFIKAFEEVQPEWRQVIDLTLTEDKLLTQMKPKGRYNISVARRHMVTVMSNFDLKTFYKLYQLTTIRARVSSRPINYFQKLQLFSPKNCQIFIASHQHQPLAAALVIFWAGTATYLYGGSTAEHRQAMAPYLLHWEIMCEAKRRGCTKYDMGAVAPMTNDELPIFQTKIQDSKFRNLEIYSSFGFRNLKFLNQKMHSKSQSLSNREKKLAQKYAGITRFKQQFGGQTIHIIGSYDLIFKPVWYRLYRFIESWRRK